MDGRVLTQLQPLHSNNKDVESSSWKPSFRHSGLQHSGAVVSYYRQKNVDGLIDLSFSTHPSLCILTLHPHPASSPCILTLHPRHHPRRASSPCILTLHPHRVSSPCILTLHPHPASSPSSSPCILTLHPRPASSPCILALHPHPASKTMSLQTRDEISLERPKVSRAFSLDRSVPSPATATLFCLQHRPTSRGLVWPGPPPEARFGRAHLQRPGPPPEAWFGPARLQRPLAWQPLSALWFRACCLLLVVRRSGSAGRS
ncbi:uncharacterized protein V6R79_019758 [Siganus canaliculatus]